MCWFNTFSITIFILAKETNRLINKGMCVLLFDVLYLLFKKYCLEKLMFSKLVGKVNFSERKLEEMQDL